MSLRRCGTGTQSPLWDRLADLTMPTLLIAGANDAKFASIVGEMADVIPEATLEIVADVGHTPTWNGRTRSSRSSDAGSTDRASWPVRFREVASG